jgi:hypothetical protein
MSSTELTHIIHTAMEVSLIKSFEYGAMQGDMFTLRISSSLKVYGNVLL